MSYLVLARKWRPKNFAEMVGQEHVLRALMHALDHNRVHHAFLFTGTRGVGKTTVSRILAKSLNCDRGVSSTPCGECSACREIDEGRFVDLIEVDAASRTKVEDTRELLENVQYAPTRGRYKVYLIDEVHMLSAHSFNALLKTLEEPPPHVKFLLATTDPQKLPVTVLSRVLQFHLKRLSAALIGERMRHILTAEAVEFEPAALPLLARAADGSMRDGLSLLDQVLVFGGGRVSEPDVRGMLGTIDRGHVARILGLLAAGDAPGVLEQVAALDEQAPDYDDVLVELAALLQRLALQQAVPGAGADDVWDEGTVAELATQLHPEDVQLFYQMALNGRRDLPMAPDPRLGFEMTLLRMLAFRPAEADMAPRAATRSAPLRPRPAQRSVAAPPPLRPAPSVSSAVASGVAPAVAPVVAKAATPTPKAGTAFTSGDWRLLIERLNLSGAVKQLATNCEWVERTATVVKLRLDARSAVLQTEGIVEKLGAALTEFYGQSMRIDLELVGELDDSPARMAEREAAELLARTQALLEQEPVVRLLRERFGGVLDPASVKPR
jgi:DNA polymerase-3 subunit gamma/tau